MVNGRRMAGKNVEEPQLDETRDNKLALTNQVIGNNAYLKPGLKPDLKPDLMQNSKQPNLINKVKNKFRGKFLTEFLKSWFWTVLYFSTQGKHKMWLKALENSTPYEPYQKYKK